MKRLPTWVEINLDQLAQNILAIRNHLGEGVEVLLTVKADAYGHGAVQVAQTVQGDVQLLGVATLDEAIELKEAGIRTSILILSPVLETEIEGVASGGFGVTVSSRGFAERLSRFGEARGHTFDVHVEVDTGMGRTGVPEAFAREEIARIAAMPALDLRGVYTHFPVSDTDVDFTKQQIATLRALVDELGRDGVDVPLAHCANSAAVADIDESHMGMVRPGLLAFGLHPSGNEPRIDVAPIMSWKSRIARVRRVAEGKSISYGRNFVTQRDSWIGVVPVGYGHGYPFRLSNRGEMIVHGCKVPIVGRVTMDITMVDLTDLDAVPDPGEEVVLVGRQGNESITFHDVADRAGTIGYEIMCGISKRVPRTYFRRGRIETYKSLLGILANGLTV